MDGAVDALDAADVDAVVEVDVDACKYRVKE